jgi:hypothetical protein
MIPVPLTSSSTFPRLEVTVLFSSFFLFLLIFFNRNSKVNAIILHFNCFYANTLLRLTALAFDLSMRDYNIEPAHDNRATAGVAADAVFQEAISPVASLISEALTYDVIDFYYEGYSHVYANTEPRNEKEEAERAGKLYKDYFLATRNEARQMAGLESIGPAGDFFADGLNINGTRDPAFASNPIPGEGNNGGSRDEPNKASNVQRRC